MNLNVQMRCSALMVALLAGCAGQQANGVEPTVVSPPPPPPAITAAPVVAAPPAPEKAPEPLVSQAAFGKLGDQPVSLYTLKNQHGLTAKVMTYGATLTEMDVPDRDGRFSDVVLGFDTFDEYLKDNPYFGATIGRVANRIKKARFELDGKTYTLAANNAPNALHGGKRGWDKVIWDAQIVSRPNAAAIAFSYVSKSGEEGYPGTVSAKVTYSLTNDNELRVDFEATTDTSTPVSMAHHTYWNLAGQSSGTLLDQEITINADKYTPGDPVPDGSIKPVKGTPFDFTVPKAIGKDLKAAGGKPVGYDLNYVINGNPTEFRKMAKLKDPKSGRVLTLSSEQPGMVFYSGNFLDGTVKGKGGTAYAQYTGLCIESGKFPNSINVPAWKGAVVLKPGQTYRHSMVHAFSAE